VPDKKRLKKTTKSYSFLSAALIEHCNAIKGHCWEHLRVMNPCTVHASASYVEESSASAKYNKLILCTARAAQVPQ
jgi:hypothetical protein